MKTVGEIIRSQRIRKKYSFKDLERLTKIKGNFIDLIEREKWESLPPFPTVLGFVKSLSGVLDLNEKVATALLKRDYPPRNFNINPKQEIKPKFSWNPKLTFLISVLLVALGVFGYIGFQYYHFVSPPALYVESPKQNQVVATGSVLVFGSTDSDAKITVNSQPILVSDDGTFSVDLQVAEGTKEIDIVATSRSGKTTVVSRKIEIR